ncbi:MAG: phenylacetate--CoA ligase family protein [Desulfosarcina sp.]|nr:phenylacetate--CoA ligase family protein [Desulfosarcina sp.]
MSFHLEDHLYGSLKSIYNSSPQAFKSVIGRVYRSMPDSLRYGETYGHYLSLLEKSQWWSKKKILAYQWEKTKNLLWHAYNNVPYYKTLFDQRGISIANIQNFQDFKKIPFLTKNIIRENFTELLAKNYKKSKLIPVATGGTTGAPLTLYYEKGVSRPLEYAFTVHGLGRIGFRVGDRIVVIRGEVVKGANQKAPSYFDPIRNRLVLSSYNMIEENLPYYIEKIRKFKPKFLHVYPSSLVLLARFMKDYKVDYFPALQGIIASSETIHQWQFDLFQEVFKCNVFPWYGLNELVALAGACEFSSRYHLFPEYSYVEFVRDDDFNEDTHNKNICEIVGTGFGNYAMPLIRYRTLDYAIPTDAICKCGRNYPMMEKVVGRKQEFFVDKTGSLITFIYADVPLWSVKRMI